MAAATLLAVSLPACAAGGATDGAPRPAIILASASLTEAFTEVERELETSAPRVEVEIGYGSASMLAEQIRGGAPADLFASADEHNIDKVVESGDALGEPVSFAHNSMQIIVAAGNPAGVTGLADLTNPELTVALAAPEVPVGRTARESFESAGLTVPEASQEPDVKAVVTRVMLGEADAGIVWRTDVVAAGDDAAGVDLPEEHNASSPCMVVAVSSGDAPEAAAEFQELLLSTRGQEILADHGFETG